MRNSCPSVLIILTFVCVFGVIASNNRTFKIDFDRNIFLKDGEEFRYISGSFHYFRSVEDYWDDIFHKFQLAGLNAIETYVEWSSHQPTPKENYTFEGNLNIFKFLETAQQNDLLVILRPGPFIDAERDMGGLPPWLLWQKRGMSLRTKDLDYVYFVSRWFDHLLPLLKPYLYSNGGPIIMIQVENEYGSYNIGHCDKDYTSFLRDLIRLHLGDDIVLFTTDGAGSSFVNCGMIPDVYPTVDFGPGNMKSVNDSFNVQRHYAPNGPLVNSEFYPGWLDHWGKPHSTVNIAPILETLNHMLSLGANVNIYMFYGGTSFGYGSGSNIDNNRYDPCPTSYDYDAPLNEARDPTLKYFAIKNVIAKYKKVPNENPIFSKKSSYGKVQMKRMTHVLNKEFLLLFSPPVQSKVPLSFEDLKIGSGFVLYSTNITFRTTDPTLLSLTQLKDRAYIYVDDMYVGVLSRTENILSIPIFVRQYQILSIFVENQGRMCYGDQIGEGKGIGDIATLGKTKLYDWTMYPLQLDGRTLNKYARTMSETVDMSETISNNFRNGVGLFWGNFTIPTNTTSSSSSTFLLDTFVRFDGWTKGSIWINGFNLGRYWPDVGPQQTLYLPGPLLKRAPLTNFIVVMELEQAPSSCFDLFNEEKCSIYLTDTHIINGPTPNELNSVSFQEKFNLVMKNNYTLNLLE